jgi:hypothetical protein
MKATLLPNVKISQYFPYDAELLEDGVLRVHWCGTDESSLLTGVYDVSPDNPDYKFWLWLKEGRPKRWFRLAPTVGMDEQTITQFRQQYEHQYTKR